jgi:thermitase
LVAVLDTGVDCSNPELQRQLRVSGTSINWPSKPAGPCPPGVGKDFVGRTDDDPSPCGTSGRCHWHGTHMAAVIAAETDNGLGIAAVAPNARLLIVRTNNEWDTPTTPRNRSFAIRYAVDEGASILNISQNWSIWSNVAMQSALRYAYARKTLVNVAAGNYRSAMTTDHLSSFPNVTYAMALSDRTTLWSGSNRACWQGRAILAPGYQIHAAIVSGNVEKVNGTSPATAFVSGAHALLKSVPTYQNYTAIQIHDLLFNSTPQASFDIQGATGPCKPQILCLASLAGGQCP